MTSLIEKVRDVLNLHLEYGATISPFAAEEVIQVVLREMMEWERNTIFQSRAQMFAHKHGIDLTEPKP